MKKQGKQDDWNYQWEHFQDDSLFLFKEWIYPNKLENFENKTVLEGGCGGGQHTNFVAKHAKEITAIDLNTTEISKKRNKENKNVNFIEDDIATMNLNKRFDIVFSIGVIHHTDDPNKTFNNLKKHLNNEGRLIIWVYSKEGNFLNWAFLEPIKKLFFLKLNKKLLMYISSLTTALMYVPIYTIYLLPLRFLPFYDYFKNWRKFSFYRNNLNIFDKLNAPQTHFIEESTVKKWFNDKEFKDVFIDHYVGVSWRASGNKR